MWAKPPKIAIPKNSPPSDAIPILGLRPGVSIMTFASSKKKGIQVRVVIKWNSAVRRTMSALKVKAKAAPNDPPAPFAARATAWNEDVLVAGHLPFLTRLTSYLVTGDADRPTVAYRPGTVVRLERAEGETWQIAWMLRPEIVP